MTEEALRARREYQRQYRERNPEKIRRWTAEFWERKAKQVKEQKGAGEAHEH